MSLKFDPNQAKQADRISAAITQSGKYIGTIERAEKLLSLHETQGVGLSFKTSDGSTSDYLDLYTVKADGTELPSLKTLNAIMCVLKLREASEGKITVEKYSKETKSREQFTVDGYPALMNKRIGLLLQKELSTNKNTGADVERMNICGVFDPETGLTASEILDRKTQPEKLAKMEQWLAANPVRDSRKRLAAASHNTTPAIDAMDLNDDIPF